MKNIFTIIYPLFCSIYVSCKDNETQLILNQFQYLYFMENESYLLDQQQISISFQDEEDLQRKIETLSFIKLIEKQKEFNLGFDDNSTLLTSLNNQGQFIDICALQHQRIDCKIRINNTLYNDDIIINEITSNSIQLPSQNCSNAFAIEYESFLIHCQSTVNQFSYFIINNNSLILDEIIIDLSLDCRFQSKFQFNKILIYSTDCEVSILIFIEIINKDYKAQFNHNFTKLHELYNYPKETNLIDLKFCESNQILLIYENIIYIFYLNNHHTFGLNFQINRQLVDLDESCFPYVIRGSFSSIVNINRHKNILQNLIQKKKESQIKRIQTFENLSIFLYENEVDLMNCFVFKQSISNIKQINQLNTLPFFVTLDKNNNISIYKILCFQKTIRKENYPFIAIYQRDFYGMVNKYLPIYYKTSSYSIQLPIQIPLLQINLIESNFLSETTFQIDTLQFKLPIPIYLELIVDSHNISHQLINEVILTHHKKLPIKKILKVISFKIDFIVIIYEDWNHKIFVNIQGQNFRKNVNVMSMTTETSVEYFKVDVDYIIILFIKSDQIATYEIVDNKDLIYKNTILTKNKIKEYKVDKYKLICLFFDNTILSYSSNIWSQYLYTQKKELQEFWLKNKDKYEDFRVPYLYINTENSQLEIKPLIPSQYRVLLSVNGQILNSYIFVPENRVILLVQNEDIIQLQNYYFEINQIQFLYQIPTYEFQIQYPLKIKCYGKLFGIITTKNGEDYLFIYDITQQGSSCLRQIIKMYPNYTDFELIDETGILSQNFLDKIIINYPNILISINQTKKQYDNSIIQYKIQFEAKSFIESTSSSVSVNFQMPNTDSNLRFKFNAQYNMLLVNNQNEIININSIYGSINSLQLSNQCNGFIQAPIQVLQTQVLSCTQIIQELCLIHNVQFIYDFFGSNKTIFLPINQKIFGNFYSSYQIILMIYDKYNSSIAFAQISKNYPIEQNLIVSQFYTGFKMNDIYHKIQSINSDNSVIIVYSEENVQIYSSIGNQNNFSYSIDCLIKKESLIQVEFLCNDDSQYFFLTLSSTNNITLSNCLKNTKALNQSINFSSFFKIVAFHILHFEKYNSEIHLNVILFCPKDIGYIVEIKIDLIQFQLLDQSIRQLIRYLNVTFEKFQKLTETMFILKGISDKSISTTYLYNINRNSSIEGESVDYFYKYEQAEDIQNYNETHFIQIRERDEGKIVELIQINQYKVILKENKCNLVLDNDVSRFITTIIQEENTLIYSQTILYLVIVNFILIIIFNGNKKKHYPARCQRS